MTGPNQDNYLKKELSGKRDKMNGLYLCGGPKARYSSLEEIIYQWSQAGYSFQISVLKPIWIHMTSEGLLHTTESPYGIRD